jgi:hypothetical protein
MPEPTSEERLLRGLAELEATRVGAAPSTPGTTRTGRPHVPTPRDPSARPARPARQAPPSVDAGAAQRYGWLAALLLPAALGVLAVLLRSAEAPSRLGAFGFVVAVLAAPLLPVVGIPLRSGTTLVLVGIAASAVLWMVLGWWASRRSRSWPGFAVEFGWMVLAVWLGSGLAALAANLVLGRPAL